MGVDSYAREPTGTIDLDGIGAPNPVNHYSHRSLVLERERPHEERFFLQREEPVKDRLPRNVFMSPYAPNYDESYFGAPNMNFDYSGPLQGHHVSHSQVSSNNDLLYPQYDHADPVFQPRPSESMYHLSSEPPLLPDPDLIFHYVRPQPYSKPSYGHDFSNGLVPRNSRFSAFTSSNVHSRTNSQNSGSVLPMDTTLPVAPLLGQSPLETESGVKKLPYACRDFRSGHCQRGESCRFLHVLDCKG